MVIQKPKEELKDAESLSKTVNTLAAFLSLLSFSSIPTKGEFGPLGIRASNFDLSHPPFLQDIQVGIL